MRASNLGCGDLLFPAGDGDRSDLFLGNDVFRVVLRHPQASLSLAGLGGLTVIDGAPWGRGDMVYELAPLIGGGWLDVEAVELGDGTIRATGTIRSLPTRAAARAGERAEVTWRVEPGDPWLYADGADGFWVHPSLAMERVDGWLLGDPAVIGHAGDVVEDLGGAMVVSGSRVLLGESATAWAQRGTTHRNVSGTAPDATAVELWRGDARVGRIPVSAEGAYAATVPADVDTLRAVAPGRAPSASLPAGTDVALSVGGTGTLTVQVSWPTGARQRPLVATWTGPDGRAGTARLAPDGGTLPLGAGASTVTLSAGPTWTRRTLPVELADGAEQVQQLAMYNAFRPYQRVLASLDWRAGRDRSVARPEADRAREALAQAIEFAVVSSQDDVTAGSVYLNDAPWLRVDTGLTLTSPAGWRVTSWPWSESGRRSGHGAPAVRDLTLEQLLHLAWGGPSVDRTVRVDLATLEALGPGPWAVEPAPDFVGLGAPGEAPFAAWAPWFRWLDGGRFLRPSGPLDWLDVETPSRYGAAELNRALRLGRLSAGTGAWIEVRVDGAGAGEVVRYPEDSDSDTDATAPAQLTGRRHNVVVDLRSGGFALDRLTVVTDGGRPVATITPDRPNGRWSGTLEVGTWVTAIAWSSTTQDWAVAMPVWTRRPSTLPDDETDTPIDTPVETGTTEKDSP